jgi:hypothetical protein
MTMPDDRPQQSSILLHQTEDGRTRIQCRLRRDDLADAEAHGGAVPETATDGKSCETWRYSPGDEITGLKRIAVMFLDFAEDTRRGGAGTGDTDG